MKIDKNDVNYDFSDRGQVVEIEITEEPVGVFADVRFAYGANVIGFWNETNFRKEIMGKCDGYTLWKDNRVRGNGCKRMSEVCKAVKLLRPLLEGLAEDREETVDVYADVYNGDYITVTINKAKYEINVTAENVRSIVQSVVNRVALKL
jgi:hypothetical protein